MEYLKIIMLALVIVCIILTIFLQFELVKLRRLIRKDQVNKDLRYVRKQHGLSE